MCTTPEEVKPGWLKICAVNQDLWPQHQSGAHSERFLVNTAFHQIDALQDIALDWSPCIGKVALVSLSR
jgi:hypothetical protein